MTKQVIAVLKEEYSALNLINNENWNLFSFLWLGLLSLIEGNFLYPPNDVPTKF